MRIVVMPGDDIGPEISAAAMLVLEQLNQSRQLGLAFETIDVGMASFRQHGVTLTETGLAAARNADGVILGPCGMTAYPPRDQGGINVPGTIRKDLQLFANLRPARTRPGVPDARAGLDVLIVRENTEGFYADRNMARGIAEFLATDDVALSIRKITRQGSHRIARVAFEMARKRRGKVTVVGKRHVLQITDGLFVEETEKVAAEFPDVKLEEIDIDAAAADLYSRPARYDVVLTTNMFGDILSNQVVAMSGSLGLAAALNVGAKHAIANAGHGSAPDIAGKGVANPSGLLLSCAMLLDWFGARHGLPQLTYAANDLNEAIDRALSDPAVRTGDLGGSGTTKSFAEHIRDDLPKG